MIKGKERKKEREREREREREVSTYSCAGQKRRYNADKREVGRGGGRDWEARRKFADIITDET